MGTLGTRYNGGMSVYVRELAGELGRLGHEVDIYTGFPEEGHPAVMQLRDGVRLIHLGAGTDPPLTPEAVHARLPDHWAELERFVDAENRAYDLVHSHYWISGPLGERARRKWNLPHVLMFHTIGEVKNRSCPDLRESEVRLRVERELADSCTRILANTEQEKELIVRHCGASAGRIGVVPCGVNLKRFPLQDRAKARDRLGLPPQGSILLFVGRFDSIKGIDRLISAMAYLTHPRDVRLVLVGGDGPRAPETLRSRDLARSKGVAGRVQFVGRVPQDRLPVYYAAADALVIPSSYESFGLVALEALACGTPVLGAPVGVLPSLLRDRTLGEILPDTSPPRLAGSIEQLLARLETRPPLPREIRDAVRPFRWSGVARAVLGEYAKVLESEHAPPGMRARHLQGGPA
jgi:D-inositol-3-phosphate glycosyltransferase